VFVTLHKVAKGSLTKDLEHSTLRLADGTQTKFLSAITATDLVATWSQGAVHWLFEAQVALDNGTNHEKLNAPR
jgi:hypothetical protein